MSFQTEMEARFGAENVKQWTNPGPNTNTASVNTTILAAVLVDVEGDFRKYAGVLYDDTDNRMIGIACERAAFRLKNRGGSAGMLQDLDDYTKAQIKEVRKVTNANRLIPGITQINSYSPKMDNVSFADSKKLSQFGFPQTPGFEGQIDRRLGG